MVLGFQDIDSLREVYGENIAGVITSQCNCKAILRLESPRTAEWASKLFGEYEAIETRRSEARGTTTPTGIGGSQGSKSHTVTDTEHYIKRQSVMESQLYLIPVTTPETGLTGYYVVPGIGAYRHTYPGAWLFPDEKNSALPAAEVSDFQPWGDPHAQWLKPWNEEQLWRRGIVVTEAVKTAVAQETRTAVGGEVTEATVERPPEPRIATEEETEDFIKKRLTRRFKARKEE